MEKEIDEEFYYGRCCDWLFSNGKKKDVHKSPLYCDTNASKNVSNGRYTSSIVVYLIVNKPIII